MQRTTSGHDNVSGLHYFMPLKLSARPGVEGRAYWGDWLKMWRPQDLEQEVVWQWSHSLDLA